MSGCGAGAFGGTIAADADAAAAGTIASSSSKLSSSSLASSSSLFVLLSESDTAAPSPVGFAAPLSSDVSLSAVK